MLFQKLFFSKISDQASRLKFDSERQIKTKPHRFIGIRCRVIFGSVILQSFHLTKIKNLGVLHNTTIGVTRSRGIKLKIEV